MSISVRSPGAAGFATVVTILLLLFAVCPARAGVEAYTRTGEVETVWVTKTAFTRAAQDAIANARAQNGASGEDFGRATLILRTDGISIECSPPFGECAHEDLGSRVESIDLTWSSADTAVSRLFVEINPWNAKYRVVGEDSRAVSAIADFWEQRFQEWRPTIYIGRSSFVMLSLLGGTLLILALCVRVHDAIRESGPGTIDWFLAGAFALVVSFLATAKLLAPWYERTLGTSQITDDPIGWWSELGPLISPLAQALVGSVLLFAKKFFGTQQNTAEPS